MEKNELQQIITNPPALIEQLKVIGIVHDKDKYKLYHPENHDVFDEKKREDKHIKKPSGQTDSAGKETLVSDVAKVVRVGVPAQQLIVNRASAFTAGAPVQIMANPETEQEKALLRMIKKVWTDNKLDYKNMPIAEAMMSQQEVAEIWYFEDSKPGYWGSIAPAAEKRMRMIVVRPSEKNEFYPIFDAVRNMIGFGRIYPVGIGDTLRKWLDLYTEDAYYFYEEVQGKWRPRPAAPDEEENLRENLLNKIPVIYYQQKRTEWEDVQSLISRLEELLSNHGDINDYNGSPTIVAYGEIKGFSTKGERGKALQMDAGADIKILAWDAAPESIKLEIETLLNGIYTYTQTPNISFEAVKGIGVQSGVAIKLLFLDAHSKARRKHYGSYGEAIQRRLNLIKEGCIKINNSLESAAGLEVWPEFSDYMPTNDLEEAQIRQYDVNAILAANGNKVILSQETALSISPFEIEDTEEEQTRINNEARKDALTGPAPRVEPVAVEPAEEVEE